MLVILLLFVVFITAPVVIGFRKTIAQRRLDPRHFAAFVGFGAAVLANIATIIFFIALSVIFRSHGTANPSPTGQGLIFVSGSVGIISSAIAFFAGVFSWGIRRVTLLVFGPVMGRIYVLAAFSNFGA